MIRVLIFEDNPDFIDSLSELINNTSGIELTGIYTNCKNAVKNVAHHQPDVVLIDIDIFSEDCLQFMRSLRAAEDEVNVLMLTVFDDNDRVFQAICNGASGYILKSTRPEKIIEIIKEATTSGTPMTPTIAKRVLKLFSQPFRKSAALETLTTREYDVLSFLVRGYSYKMIGAELKVSIETLHSYNKNIYDKLHVNSKSEVVAKAIQSMIL